MIKIFTDSTSYIPVDLQQEYDLTVLPISLTMGGKEYLETEIDNDTFYADIKKSNEIPKTIPLSTQVIADAFEKEIIEGHTVLAIFISAKMSEIIKNANAAKNKLIAKYPRSNITIVDSQSNSMQEGLAVLAAAETAKKGAWLEDVIKSADNTIHHTRYLFIPETLKYLEIAGRLGKAQAFLGNALQITPILSTKGGEAFPLESVRTKNKAISKMLEIFKSDIDVYGVKKVIVHHIDCIDDAQKMAKQAEEIARLEVPVIDLGAVMGANVGPGAIGIVYETVEALPND